MTHPQDLSLRAQADAIQKGELDAVELLDATIDRLHGRDRDLNSTPVVFDDESRRMLADAPPGPLPGVPLTIKDMYALPWRAARNGTPLDLFPACESGAFRRLRDAGAVIVGVANQHEAGMGTTGALSAYGPHRNPWQPDHCPGGSSGGSAAAGAAPLVRGSVRGGRGRGLGPPPPAPSAAPDFLTQGCEPPPPPIALRTLPPGRPACAG